MSDPLVPERSGSLAELGLSPHPDMPLDEENGMEEEAQAATAEEATLPEQEAEMPQEAAESPEEGDQGVEEPPEPESLLAAIMGQDGTKEDESEVARMRQELANLRAAVDAREEAYKEVIRSAVPAQQKAEPEPDEDDLLKSVPVRQILQSLREEDPAEYEAALVRIAEEQTTRKVSKQINELRSMIEQRQEQEKQEQMATRYQQGINRVLEDIEGKGGLEAELIKQLRDSPQQSYLGAKFQENPTRLMSEEGIRGTVISVAAQLQSQYKGKQQSRGQVVSPSVEASAGGGGVSRRGVSLGEKPKQLSEEDQIIEDMMNAGNRVKSLGFL